MPFIKDLYKTYRFIFPYRHSNKPIRAILLLENFIKGVVLDVGCGDGRNLIFLEIFSNEVIGLDIDLPNISTLRKLGKSVILHDIKNIPLPFKDNCFDFILCSHVLEHIVDPQSVIQDFIRICRPSGVIIIAVPNADCLFYDFYDFEKHPGHINKMKRNQWEKVLQDEGLFISKRFSNFPFFWNKTWGKFINRLPVRNFLPDIWFVCEKARK